MIGYCLIDTNNIGFAAHRATKLNAGGLETQAIFGVIRTIRQIYGVHGHSLRPIALWDGRSWRKQVYPEYKGNRTKDPKQVATIDGYKAQRPEISRGLKHLGVAQMIAANMEADDLAALTTFSALTRKQKVVLITADRDWLQLVHDGVTWHDPIHDIRINVKNFADKTGYASARQFLHGKALQGDTSDNISGVGGIGEKGAAELIKTYGDVGGFLSREWSPEEVGALPSKFREFLQSTEKLALFNRNLRLMDLQSPLIPKPEALTLNAGDYNEDAFRDFCGEFAFGSILSDFENWIEPFRLMQRRIAEAKAA